MFTGLFAKLLAFPLIGKVAGFFTTERRSLIFGYVMILAVVVIGGFTVTLWASKNKVTNDLHTAQLKLTAAEQRIDKVEMVNQAQEATISDLRELRLRDAKAVAGLFQDMDRLGERDARVRQQLTSLEKNNAAVRSYLDQPVPSDLRELLKQ